MLSLFLLLATQCPPAFVQNTDGLCYLNSPFLTSGKTGLQKALKVNFGGLSPKKIDLGKRLFFDKALSGDGTLSCASCHDPKKSFTDGLARSVGKDALTRSAPPLWNVGFFESYFWDGRVDTLEKQLRGPLFSPHEMDTTPEKLTEVLNTHADYPALFAEAFGGAFGGKVTFDQLAEALATFERSLVSLWSRYDRYVFGETKAMNAKEVRGFTLFRSFVTRCTECHEPPLFTNFQMARIGAPDTLTEKDMGQYAWTQKEGQERVFRIPSLRNIALTAPYMHSGVFPSLSEVIDFYNAGGGRYDNEYNKPAVHWHIGRMGLSRTEREDLVAFLGTLTDTSSWPQ
ncbi:MAG: cytochrome c peroxidase [Bdellovibrionota bacterium]